MKKKDEVFFDASILDTLITKKYTSGDIVRLHRKRLQLNQEDLAKITGIKANLISQYETGSKKIGKEVAETFAVALDIRPESILYPNGTMELTPKLKKISERSHSYQAKLKVGKRKPKSTTRKSTYAR